MSNRLGDTVARRVRMFTYRTMTGTHHGAFLAGPAAGKADDPSRARLADLVREGVVSPGDPQALADWLDGHAPVKLPAGSPNAVDVLLEQRRESTR